MDHLPTPKNTNKNSKIQKIQQKSKYPYISYISLSGAPIYPLVGRHGYLGGALKYFVGEVPLTTCFGPGAIRLGTWDQEQARKI